MISPRPVLVRGHGYHFGLFRLFGRRRNGDTVVSPGGDALTPFEERSPAHGANRTHRADRSRKPQFRQSVRATRFLGADGTTIGATSQPERLFRPLKEASSGLPGHLSYLHDTYLTRLRCRKNGWVRSDPNSAGCHTRANIRIGTSTLLQIPTVLDTRPTIRAGRSDVPDARQRKFYRPPRSDRRWNGDQRDREPHRRPIIAAMGLQRAGRYDDVADNHRRPVPLRPKGRFRV